MSVSSVREAGAVVKRNAPDFLHRPGSNRISHVVKIRVAIAVLLATVVLSAKDVVFPTTTASNLAGEKLTFPGGLRGERNLVLIAFKREQQTDVDTWLKELPSMLASHPGVAYYEVPVIDKLNPMVRWFINSGMRRGIPDKAQRARTVTFYLDKKVFKSALDITTEERIHALLLDRGGKVLWRADGPLADASKASLLNALSSR